MKYYLLFFPLLFLLGVTNKKLDKGQQIEGELVKVRIAYKAEKIKDCVVPLQKIIKVDTILPNEVSFFLGITLFEYKNFDASEKALLRYLKLTNAKGKHFEVTGILLKEIWSKKKIDKCRLCVEYPALSEILDCKECIQEDIALKQKIKEDCLENGMALCDVCEGEGILMRTGPLGNVLYRTCHKCHGEGYIPCPHLKKKE
ncbi:MAG: hypothetical protein GY827_01155 [Cytophagales bacterium]|nr:hypothetical protein [Cytophagales bacterium]